MEDLDMRSRGGAVERPGPARQAAGAASDAAGDVAGTAKEQARTVASEVSDQTRNLIYDARRRVTEQARTQNDRLTDLLRRMADELDDMGKGRGESPARSVVAQVAQGGRRMADYLSMHGPEGVLREVQDFARRRPGAFLATAVAAGFVVGRLGKSVLTADGPATRQAAGWPAANGYPYPPTEYPGYAETGAGYTGRDYPAGTGTAAYPATGEPLAAESTTYRSASATGDTDRPAATPVSSTDEVNGRHDPTRRAEGSSR